MQFLLLAFVIFWLVRVVTTVRKHIEAQAARLLEDKKAQEAAKPAAPAPTPEDVALLREIRDLLKAQQNQTNNYTTGKLPAGANPIVISQGLQ